MTAPPDPSATIDGAVWSFRAVHTGIPFALHNSRPFASRRWAKISSSPALPSVHAMIAPPSPSPAMAGYNWSPGAVQTGEFRAGSWDHCARRGRRADHSDRERRIAARNLILLLTSIEINSSPGPPFGAPNAPPASSFRL